jgi:hypothetical protein
MSDLEPGTCALALMTRTISKLPAQPPVWPKDVAGPATGVYCRSSQEASLLRMPECQNQIRPTGTWV